MSSADGVAEAADALGACGVTEAEAEKKAAANKKKREKAKAKKAASKLGTICELADATQYLTEARQTQWWAVYQEAFKSEHEWMEARKQTTSRQSGLDAQGMVALIFHSNEAAFTRMCFFARHGGEAEPCAYATVDVDADAEKVCHLRMLLVAPSYQRQGIGLSLLRHVVAHFEEHGQRQLGLKYSRCNDYHSLYSQVGFKRIGSDDHFVYMALGRIKNRSAPKPRVTARES